MKEKTIIGFTILASLITFALIFLFTKNIGLAEKHPMPWESSINAEQKTVVFNLVLEESKLIDGAKLFGADVEASLFEDPDGREQIEAYFSNTKVGGIGAKIILNLETNASIINQLSPYVDKKLRMPSGVIKTSYLPGADQLISQLTINALSFVPKADLDEVVIKKLFGEADRIEIEPSDASDDENIVSHWYYPGKGLRIILGTKENEIFEFSNQK